MNVRFTHNFLGVTNLKRSLEFYQTVFEDAKISRKFEIDGNELIFLDLGVGLTLEMTEFPPEIVKTGVVDVVDNGSPLVPYAGVFQHIAIEVYSEEDLRALYDRMLAAGAGIVRPLNFGFSLHNLEGGKDIIANGAHLKGPDGEVIELCYDIFQ